MKEGLLFTFIDELKRAWEDTYSNLSKQLDIQVLSGATYGEICGLVGAFLKKLKEENHPGYLVSKELIDKMIKICTDWFHN